MDNNETHEIEIIPQYKTKSEKERFFNLVEANSIDELLSTLSDLESKQNYFRGVNNWKYKIFSSYHRYLFKEKYPYVDEASLSTSKILKDQFEKIIKDSDFAKTAIEVADHYCQEGGEYMLNNAFDRHLILAMSKLQHYVNISCMVDFSYDPYIALFFSTYGYSGNEPASLIYFPKDKINHLDLETNDSNVYWYGNRKQFIEWLKDPEILKHALHVMGQSFLVNPTICSINFEKRFLFNELQQKQKGCFMIYRPNYIGGPKVEPLEELICSELYNPRNRENMVKPTSIEIPGNLISKIEKILESKNITGKVLTSDKNDTTWR